MNAFNVVIRGWELLGAINPAGLPALRIAGMFFLAINIIAIIYVFQNRHRFFGKDPDVPDDLPENRKVRIELILIPWLFLTTYLVVVLVKLWSE